MPTQTFRATGICYFIIIIININTTITGINMLTIVNCEHHYWLNSTNESSALNVEFKQENVYLDLTIRILRIYKLIVGLILWAITIYVNTFFTTTYKIYLEKPHREELQYFIGFPKGIELVIITLGITLHCCTDHVFVCVH